MPEFLEGWDYERAVENARSTNNARHRKSLMVDADTLRDLRHALNRAALRGLCVYCGAKMVDSLPGLPPRCYCRADD